MFRPLYRAHGLRPFEVHLYHVCENLTGAGICLMIVLSPWAFGTTQHWAIGSMNAAGFALGTLLSLKLLIRALTGYARPGWMSTRAAGTAVVAQTNWLKPGRLTGLLAILTLFIVAYCLVAAINSAATYESSGVTFIYHSRVNWLPHSFESHSTWRAFWNYFALACSFWAIVDWLRGASTVERRAVGRSVMAASTPPAHLPARFRTLLWVLSINGAVLAIEAIVQRLERSGRLLFLIKPSINSEALSQFGPYHYRGSAATYFNLLWPVCLGFWWLLHCSRPAGHNSHHVLWFCGIIMAACPIISASRTGAFVMVGISIVALAAVIIPESVVARRKREYQRTSPVTQGLSLLFLAGALALGFSLGWRNLKPRLTEIEEGLAAREQLYQAARPILKDYPLLGTGPGTFESIFQMYRSSTASYWPAQLHNDWLETRITFGWVGTIFILFALGTVLLRCLVKGGIHAGRTFSILLWLALGGCLVQARFDFPFQVYSLLFLFLVLCAVGFNLSRR